MDHVHAPIGRLREGGAEPEHIVLEQEGHDVGQADSLLLGVGEAGDLATGNQQ